MLKQQLILEVKRGERAYQLVIPDGCPLGEVNDVLFEIRNFVVGKIMEAIKADQPQKPQEEEPKDEQLQQ